MNIWFLHHYAEPPYGQWTATHELAKHLVKRGHQVTIIASSFNHYTLKNASMRLGQMYATEYYNGVQFISVKTFPYQRNNWRRLSNMISYGVMSFWVGMRLRDKPNAIIGSSPHPFTPIAAFALSRLKRAHFCFELRDLWPQFLIEVGALPERHPIVPLFRWIERFCFRKANWIFTIWPGMSIYIEERGISPAKVVWVPVGVDVSYYEEPAFTERPDHDGTAFVVMYRGGFGNSNDIKVILDAANLLQLGGQNHIKLILAGEGSGKDEWMQYAQDLGLLNVESQGFVPKEQLPAALAQADAFLGALPGVSQFKKYGQIATKLLDYLCAGRPTILATNIRNNLVEAAQAGVVVPPGDPDALAQAILHMAAMSPEERLLMARNGLEYVKQNHNIPILAARLEATLQRRPSEV